MLDSKGHVKIIDFGHSTLLDPALITNDENVSQPMLPRGSLMYMPPELIKDRIGGRFTDWWAYGVVATELLTGRSPWPSMEEFQELENNMANRAATRNTADTTNNTPPVTDTATTTDNTGVGTTTDGGRIGRPPGVEFPQLRDGVFEPLHTLSERSNAFLSSLLNKNYKERLGTYDDSQIKLSSFFNDYITNDHHIDIDWEKILNLESEPAFEPFLILNNNITTLCFDQEEKDKSLEMFQSSLNNCHHSQVKPTNDDDNNTVLEKDNTVISFGLTSSDKYCFEMKLDKDNNFKNDINTNIEHSEKMDEN